MAKYLFLLEQKNSSGVLDEVQKFIVVSETCPGARTVAAKHAGQEGPCVWKDSIQSSCKMIGSFFEQEGLSDVIIRDILGF